MRPGPSVHLPGSGKRDPTARSGSTNISAPRREEDRIESEGVSLIFAAFRDPAKHWRNRKTFLEQLRGKIKQGESELKEGCLTNAEADAARDNATMREAMREAVGAA